MAYKYCDECNGGMRRYTLREALIDRQQECPRCHTMNILTLEDGLATIVEDWEETHHSDGEWERRDG